ncbi:MULTISPECIES: acyl-CoA dehydrogenase [unclassified Halomonas]|uniref:acyl-CoA dehydrogenase n=1 Tax=unclassified Halomonas TaxID=2609666 RepID=UPI0028848A20|nr:MULTISPECIES: acyl-CoA dehydrogenase [unclassified Halomonas]MDT0501963.1 acyl-CoA dehydrogenase [Halomonas sp. PAR7]MDT0510948.1 acyl-CoA dehydrogenase [Halomonas sp. LES1]MDT0592728.1 acyl-CoA dehydrogenase [Halomonas sp. PAR8]
MLTLILLIVAIVGLLVVMRREAGALPALAVLAITGLVSLLIASPVLGILLLLGAAGVAAAGLPALRGKWLTPRLFTLFKKVSPKVSETERVALEAGSVAWDGELFTGKPNWQALLDYTDEGLSEEEQAFLDNQCSVAAGMCNAWDIAKERADLPQPLWDHLKQERYFGMIIPKEYGGLGFSAKAQSLVLQKLSINETLMVTVGVPNSLGPGELLLKYGTDEQKNHYLPRLADGREIPCFGLTGPRAGSDATSLPDTGVVCKQVVDSEEVLGLRLNFEKRWITLAPIATVVGLAFRLFDPDHLLGEEEDRGITLALIPRDAEGMEIGRRHHPIGSPFLNGPIRGKDVFVPLDTIIGGEAMIGQGWRMLVECLSVGRCITLPSGATGTARYAIGWSGGFARIRRQFNVPVAEMEGVQEPLARMTALGYIAQAAVYQTANTIDHGEKPAVPSAILKSQLTEYQRVILGDAMDIHGGKAVTLGPRNYLGIGYSANPVAITVEGANIMTRNLMIFGQGAIRCHPYVLEELAAKDADDIQAFDRAFFGHAGLIFGNAARAFTQGLGIGKPAVPFDGEATRYAQEIARLSAGFGLCADAAMASLGATLKLREMLSARLGDVLSNLYLASMVIKQWHEGDRVEGEEALLHYSCRLLLGRAEQALDELFDNLPNRALAGVLRRVVMPLGKRFKRPHDDLARRIAQAVSHDSALRTKLLANTWSSDDGPEANFLARYNALLATQERAEGLYRTLNKAYAKGEIAADALHPEQRVEAGLAQGVISQEDAAFMREREAQVLELLTVDDFEYDAFVIDKSKVLRHNAA